MLTDPRVTNYTQTSFACPEQYEGELNTGEHFYFRYRNGWAALYLGRGGVPRGPASEFHICDLGMSVGDSLQGIFDDDEQRNSTFKSLLDDLDRMMV